MLAKLKSFWDSPYVFWALLALPALPLLGGIVGGEVPYHRLLHPSGEFSARFMIIAMMLTPLRLLFPKNRAIMWLMRRRRALGVAAFFYALLHTVLYVADQGSLANILARITDLPIWTGWVAMAIFVPLALTSNEKSLRALGQVWKRLQRLVYPAALLTLIHWVTLHYSFGGALFHFAPLAALEAYRIWHGLQRRVPA